MLTSRLSSAMFLTLALSLLGGLSAAAAPHAGKIPRVRRLIAFFPF
jgi:hypothetical protein